MHLSWGSLEAYLIFTSWDCKILSNYVAEGVVIGVKILVSKSRKCKDR